MAEPKHLPPTLRSKSRYVVFEIISEVPVSYSDFMTALWSSSRDLLGDLGSSELRLWVVKNLYDAKNQHGVIKCSHDRVEQVRALLSTIKMVAEVHAIIKIIGVTGTIKSARNKYLGMRDLHAYEPEVQ